MRRAVRAASNLFWPCHLRRLADIGWIGHFRSRLRYEVLKNDLSNIQSKPDASDHRVCGPAFHRSGARLSREVWRDHRSYPLVTAFDDRSNVRFPPNPDIQGRNASDFCIKRCYDSRGFEPDADLVNFASSRIYQAVLSTSAAALRSRGSFSDCTWGPTRSAKGMNDL